MDFRTETLMLYRNSFKETDVFENILKMAGVTDRDSVVLEIVCRDDSAENEKELSALYRDDGFNLSDNF